MHIFDFYSNWIILYSILWSIFKIGPSPWLPAILVFLGGVIIEIVNYFRNGTPIWIVVGSIIIHLIPLFIGLKKDYNLEFLIGSFLIYFIYVGDRFPEMYDNPWKALM